jgi:hypothetical protein
MKHVTTSGKSSAELFKTEKDQLAKASDIATGIKRLCDDPEAVKEADAALTALAAIRKRFA